MFDFYSENQQLNELSETVQTAVDGLDIASLDIELSQLKEKQSHVDYWKDADKARVDNQRIAVIERKLNQVSHLQQQITHVRELMQLASEMGDDSVLDEIKNLIATLDKEINALFLSTLLKGKYDGLNAILTIHAGAGGTEAQDWAEMLYRMYTRYAERAGYDINVLDYQDGDEAGIKSVTFMLAGENAYGFLKAEKGVHRLVRISPFDSNKRRHTSFASVEVMPEIIENLEIKINSDELRIDTLRSSGAGGQHVNKTESAVRITHLPTNIVVQCQNERSQIQNRETAMKMLISKLTEKREREQLDKAQSIMGELKRIEWGSQIRSYVFCPYTLVKDHRTNFENPNVGNVMDGDIEDFIYEYLKKS